MSCNNYNLYLCDSLIKVAEKSCVNQKHSAVLIKNGKIINYGYNKYCSFAKKSTIHAEMDALMTLRKKYKKHQLKNMDIVIIRISSKNNELKNSRPCNGCIDILKKSYIRRVYFYKLNKIELIFNLYNVNIRRLKWKQIVTFL